MSHQVRLSELAISDLVALHRWIAAEATPAIADEYIDRIETRVAALADFPDRGTPRDDLAPGLRTLSFERRLLIAYRVDGGTALVLRVISAQRELAPLFG
ncbi:toxin ParE1/3/4 [Sphingomonas kyeonggiensis]|uniref:type II toxin-antitoxin system RelE/ParE family toxin n=1 Tax=Sphingomonas kyeonggiensis TaxID=1268553 RepID=UPI00277FFD1D|nr:type II toxin-antitoxin system RelE/ParE family toxin [Sphingomonas kyeonggiensis]MDQ0248049.1 toxin ParE1/3/4 [Sphingomonas kyeonggiensis]